MKIHDQSVLCRDQEIKPSVGHPFFETENLVTSSPCTHPLAIIYNRENEEEKMEKE